MGLFSCEEVRLLEIINEETLCEDIEIIARFSH